MPSRPRSIRSLLHTAGPDIAGIVRQAGFFDSIRRAVLDALPDNAAPHVYVAGFDRQRLLLQVDSAGWATRLRFVEPVIRQKLAQQLRLHAETVQTRVRPLLAPSTPAPVRRHISEGNRRHIMNMARHIDDAGLAQALLRLADSAV